MSALRLLMGAMLSLCLACLPAAAQGPAWPNRPIRVLVPYAAGGAMDVLARLLAAKLQEQMGTPVIVENRSGAGGNIGADAVAKAAPDGYTILFNINGHAIAPAIYKSLPFNPDKDFLPITQLFSTATAFVVLPSLPTQAIEAGQQQGLALQLGCGRDGIAHAGRQAEAGPRVVGQIAGVEGWPIPPRAGRERAIRSRPPRRRLAPAVVAPARCPPC